MRFEYLVLALLWSAYCAVHSGLISVTVTDLLKRALGKGYAYYRLFFNLLSLVTFAPLLLYSRTPRFQHPAIFEWSGNWQILRYLLILLSAALIIGGACHYCLSQFLGIRQIRTRSSHGGITETGNIDTTGVLGITRHPWYVAVFLLLWASDLNIGTIVVNLVLSVYLVVGTLLEERKLVLEFGEDYRAYQKRVSMFFPIKWLHTRQRKGWKDSFHLCIGLFALLFISTQLFAAQAETLCTFVMEAQSGRIVTGQGACASRTTPASSFKLALALMGYDSGILKDAYTPAWPACE
jgi:methanethiol S-methyltransferase